MNYATTYSNVAPKTAFTVAAMGAPHILLDQALTYLKNVIVACDGLVYWSSGTLYWSDDIHIFYNRTDGGAVHNSIAAGSLALSDNQFAYVDLNETDDTALTATAATITTDAASNFITFNRLVLGYRNTDDDRYYPVYLNAVNVEYDDIFLPISVTKLGTTAPSWDAFHGNLSQYTFDIGDYVEGSFELPHDYFEGSNLYLHAHVITNGAEASTEVKYSIEYWIADMGEASTTTTTPTTADMALTNADGHHEYYTLGTITGTNFKIGAVVCFLFKRIALTDGTDPTSDPFVVSIGVHYLKNSLGSRSQATK